MNRAVFASLTILCLLSISSITRFNQVVKADSGTVYIRADGSIDPPTAPISTLDNMTYTLTGNINSSSDGIIVERDNVTIEGNQYTVRGPGDYDGVDVEGRTNVTVKNTTITSFLNGIYLRYANKISISGNNITENGDFGIYLDCPSNNNIINGNNITENNCDIYLPSGIYPPSSSNNSIIGNNITDSVSGISLAGSSNNIIVGNSFVNDGLFVEESFGNVVTDNLVNGKPLVYLENASDVAVDDAGQVLLIQCNHIRVENLSLSNASLGVELWQTNSSEISRNNIAYNPLGIFLSASFNNSVNGNNITNNIPNNTFAILLSNSNNNSISENNIADSQSGIYLAVSYNNSIDRNNVTSNNYGIRLFSSSLNKLYHNSFINNAYQVYFDMSKTNSVEFWDDGYPAGGNYWSDYNGTDLKSGQYQNVTGSDGIGDTPYVIDANNTDHYPLMTPVTIVPEFPSLLILPLFFITILLAVIVYERSRNLKLAQQQKAN